MRYAAVIFAASIVVGGPTFVAAAPISFCGPSSLTGCTGVEMLATSVPGGFLASYDTGAQTVGPFLGEQVLLTPTSAGLAAQNLVGGRSDALANITAWFILPQAVIEGGTGTGTMSFSWALDGSLTNGPVVGTCSSPGELGCDASIGLRYGSMFGPAVASASIPCCTQQTVDVNQAGTFDVQFTYGVPFSAAWYLVGSTGEGASTLSFLNTAEVVGLVIPTDATLRTIQAGASFGIDVTNIPGPPQSVPEPSSLLLLSVGILSTGASRFRQYRRPA